MIELPQIAVARAEQVIETDEDLAKVTRRGFIAEEKLDGARYKLHTGVSGINRIDSRRVGVSGLFVEKTDCVPHIRDMRLPSGWVLDGEVIARHGTTSHDRCANTTSVMGSLPARSLELQKEHGFVQMYLFDVLVANGTNIKHLPLYRRLAYLDSFLAMYGNETLQRMPVWVDPADFQEAYRHITEDLKGEGLVIKDTEAHYGHPKSWYKYKWHFEIDVVATGKIEPGKGKYRGNCGAVYFGLYEDDGTLRELGKCSGMDDNVRESIFSASIGGSLRGRVFECRGWEITAAGSIRNANFKRWRLDKNPTDCTIKSQLVPFMRRLK